MITRKQLETLWNYLVNGKIIEADRLYEQMLLEISQQEKVNELLDLYKTVFKNYVVEIDNVRQQQFTFLASEYKIIKGIFEQIEELESESNDQNN